LVVQSRRYGAGFFKFWTVMEPIQRNILIAVLLVAGSTCYAEPTNGKPGVFYPSVPKSASGDEPKLRPTQQMQVPATSGNSISQTAARQGAVKCSEKIAQFTNFLSGGGTAGTHVFVSPDQPDRRLATISLEVQAGQAVSYAGASFAPDSAANHCGGVYEAVTYWQNTCDEVARGAFGTFKAANPIRQTIRTLESGPSVRVYLLPAGAGCVSIKKEISY